MTTDLSLLTTINGGMMEGLGENILGAFLFLVIYEFIFKNLYYFWMNRNFIGKFFHCTLDKKKIINYGYPHYSDIWINFFNPNTLIIKSYDYTDGKLKKWEGKIKLDESTRQFGFGTYKYEDGTMGIHDVLILDEHTISFQLSYYKQPGNPYLMVKEGFTHES